MKAVMIGALVVPAEVAAHESMFPMRLLSAIQQWEIASREASG